MDRYDGFVFIVAYGASVKDGRVQQHELGVFVAPNYVITIRHEPPLDIENLRDRACSAPPPTCATAEGRSWRMSILDEVVDGYFTVMGHLQDRVEEIEETLVWGDTRSPENLAAAYRVRRDVIYLRRVVAPLREVFNALVRRDEVLFDHHLDEYFRDLYDHVIRVYEELDTDRDLLAAALEDHLSVVSNRLNRSVLKVRAWAAIIALPTFIASVYGMNFRHMPELSWGFGYGYALLLMLGTGGLALRPLQEERLALGRPGRRQHRSLDVRQAQAVAGPDGPAVKPVRLLHLLDELPDVVPNAAVVRHHDGPHRVAGADHVHDPVQML